MSPLWFHNADIYCAGCETGLRSTLRLWAKNIDFATFLTYHRRSGGSAQQHQKPSTVEHCEPSLWELRLNFACRLRWFLQYRLLPHVAGQPLSPLPCDAAPCAPLLPYSPSVRTCWNHHRGRCRHHFSDIDGKRPNMILVD